MRDYYIYHVTELPQLMSMLKDGILYANRYVKKKYWRMSGIESMPFIFTRMFLDDEYNKNLRTLGVGVILSPKLLLEQSSFYNDGWSAGLTDKTILLDVKDDPKIIKDKIEKIQESVAEKDQKEMNNLGIPLMSHELMFLGRIILKDYLLGVLCPGCDENTINKIKKILKKHEMDNVKIFTNQTFPSVDEIMT